MLTREQYKELKRYEDSEDPVQRDNLVSSLPDLIAETPKTQVAVVRVKKFLTSAGKFTADAIRQSTMNGCGSSFDVSLGRYHSSFSSARRRAGSVLNRPTKIEHIHRDCRLDQTFHHLSRCYGWGGLAVQQLRRTPQTFIAHLVPKIFPIIHVLLLSSLTSTISARSG